MTRNTRIRRLYGPFSLAVALTTAACGGGDGADAAQARVVALDTERFESIEALADAAARERGAPGDGEPVLYRLRGRAGARASAEAEQLRALGFPHVEAE